VLCGLPHPLPRIDKPTCPKRIFWLLRRYVHILAFRESHITIHLISELTPFTGIKTHKPYQTLNVQACRYLMKDFVTSQSPKSTRLRDNLLVPRPSRSPALRHSIASSQLAPAPAPEMTGRPGRRRSVDPLWRFARRVSSIALRATGDYRPPRSLSMAGSGC
jgi:hypothetical protein